MPHLKSQASGYAWRIGSVFGSQFGLRLSFSSAPGVYESNWYGPVASGLFLYWSLVSFAFGIGVNIGKVM